MEATRVNSFLDLLHKLVDVLIDRIVIFSDYFIIEKKVTMSEAAVFMLSFMWLMWFTVGGTFYHTDTPLTRLAWVVVFTSTTVTHFTAFLFKRVLGRAYVMMFHAFIWCFLSFMALFAQSAPPAFPTLSVFSLLSLMLAIRLFRESRNGA